MNHSSPAATATSADGEIRLLYEHLLEAWNRRAARAMAALFAANGSMVGFDGWATALFQSTPAAFHGRPELTQQLTNELREVLSRGLTCG